MSKARIGWLMLLALLLAIGISVGGCSLIQPAREATAKPSPQPLATPVPTAPPTQGGGEEVPLTLYKHPSGRFEISYPTGWTVEEDAESVSFTSPDLGTRILVNSADLQTPVDEQALNQFIEAFFNAEDGMGSLPGFSREEPIPQEDGSILVRYRFQGQDKTAAGGSFFEYRGTVVYALSFIVADEKNWDGMVPVLNQAANSFRPTASGGIPEDWETLTSEVGGYQFDYPPDWAAGERGGNAYVEKDQETFLYVEITTTLPVADPDEAERLLLQDVIASIQYDDPNAKVSGPDTLMIGGEEAAYADFSYIDPQTNLENMATAILVVHKGIAYTILTFTLTTDSEVNIPLFIGMVTSFRFTQ